MVKKNVKPAEIVDEDAFNTDDDINIEEVVETQIKEEDESLPPAVSAMQEVPTKTVSKLPTQVADDAEDLLQQFNALTKETNSFLTDICSSIKTFEVQHKAKTKALLARIKSQNKNIIKLAAVVPVSKGGSAAALKGTKKTSGGGSVPSGFARPCKISANLAAFIGVDPDTELSRTDATKVIHNHIKECNLQDPKNKRVIIPDDVLLSLMDVPDDVHQITYFNLQRLIKHNFITSVPPAASVKAE